MRCSGTDLRTSQAVTSDVLSISSNSRSGIGCSMNGRGENDKTPDNPFFGGQFLICLHTFKISAETC